MVKGLVIPADPERPIAVPYFSTLEDYQRIVDGWVEAVDVPSLGITICVNEEGLVRRLPFNSRATYLWWYELPWVRQQAILVGDVAIVGLPDADGETTDIPDLVLELLTTKEQYVVMTLVGEAQVWRRHPFPYDDFLDAVVWAMALSDPVADTVDVRVVTLQQLERAEQKETSHEKR